MRKAMIAIGLIVLVVVGIMVTSPAVAAKGSKGGGGGDGPPDGGESAGNCLSFPVIWAEGVTKTLPGTGGRPPILEGEWWYQWGSNGGDPDVTPASCAPDPDEGNIELNQDGYPYCDDSIADSLTKPAGYPPADNPLPLVKAYLQKDVYNVWQAGTYHDNGNKPSEVIQVDWIDWGDNLESVDWTTRSKVRTEVVLFEDQFDGDEEQYSWPMLEYEMRHTSGWGENEVHGLAATLANSPAAREGPGTRGTVYSHCARFTIQKLLVDRNDLRLVDLIWVPGDGWIEELEPEGSLINPQIFNGAVHESGDGPGYYSAEINVKGRIIYGYTWDVRNLNDMTPSAAGDYRLTFSLDDECGTVSRNTEFVDGVTKILGPIETEGVSIEEEPIEGGVGVLDHANNLIYMDIHIIEKGGGGNGGKKK